jgi:hypothetical protein
MNTTFNSRDGRSTGENPLSPAVTTSSEVSSTLQENYALPTHVLKGSLIALARQQNEQDLKDLNSQILEVKQFQEICSLHIRLTELSVAREKKESLVEKFHRWNNDMVVPEWMETTRTVIEISSAIIFGALGALAVGANIDELTSSYGIGFFATFATFFATVPTLAHAYANFTTNPSWNTFLMSLPIQVASASFAGILQLAGRDTARMAERSAKDSPPKLAVFAAESLRLIASNPSAAASLLKESSDEASKRMEVLNKALQANFAKREDLKGIEELVNTEWSSTLQSLIEMAVVAERRPQILADLRGLRASILHDDKNSFHLSGNEKISEPLIAEDFLAIPDRSNVTAEEFLMQVVRLQKQRDENSSVPPLVEEICEKVVSFSQSLSSHQRKLWDMYTTLVRLKLDESDGHCTRR